MACATPQAPPQVYLQGNPISCPPGKVFTISFGEETAFEDGSPTRAVDFSCMTVKEAAAQKETPDE